MKPSLIKALAGALKDLLLETDTPELLRDEAVLFLAKLRDGLPREQARQVEAVEAEAVILSFGQLSLTPVPQQPAGDTPRMHHRNAPLRPTKLVSSA